MIKLKKYIGIFLKFNKRCFDVGKTVIIVKAYNNRLKREKAFCVTDSIKRSVEYISSDIIKADEAMGK